MTVKKKINMRHNVFDASYCTLSNLRIYIWFDFCYTGSLWLNTNSGLNEDKAEIVVADFHGGINQQWILEVGNETTIADVLTES